MVKKIEIETEDSQEQVSATERTEEQPGEDQQDKEVKEKASAERVQSGEAGNGETKVSMDSRDADFSKLDEEEEASEAQVGKLSSRERKKLQQQVEENKTKYLRALADLENYKKRTLKEKSQLLKYQGEKVLFDFLDVADNLDLALEHAEADPEKFRTGIEMIHKMFLDILAKWEVKGKSSIGQPFDPEKHNALSRLAVDDAVPGTILNELKKVYFYKDKVLRHADVIVAAEKETEEETVESVGESGESFSNEEETPVEDQPGEITGENNDSDEQD